MAEVICAECGKSVIARFGWTRHGQPNNVHCSRECLMRAYDRTEGEFLSRDYELGNDGRPLFSESEREARQRLRDIYLYDVPVRGGQGRSADEVHSSAKAVAITVLLVSAAWVIAILWVFKHT